MALNYKKRQSTQHTNIAQKAQHGYLIHQANYKLKVSRRPQLNVWHKPISLVIMYPLQPAIFDIPNNTSTKETKSRKDKQ